MDSKQFWQLQFYDRFFAVFTTVDTGYSVVLLSSNVIHATCGIIVIKQAINWTKMKLLNLGTSSWKITICNLKQPIYQRSLMLDFASWIKTCHYYYCVILINILHFLNYLNIVKRQRQITLQLAIICGMQTCYFNNGNFWTAAAQSSFLFILTFTLSIKRTCCQQICHDAMLSVL